MERCNKVCTIGLTNIHTGAKGRMFVGERKLLIKLMKVLMDNKAVSWSKSGNYYYDYEGNRYRIIYNPIA